MFGKTGERKFLNSFYYDFPVCIPWQAGSIKALNGMNMVLKPKLETLHDNK